MYAALSVVRMDAASHLWLAKTTTPLDKWAPTLLVLALCSLSDAQYLSLLQLFHFACYFELCVYAEAILSLKPDFLNDSYPTMGWTF